MTDLTCPVELGFHRTPGAAVGIVIVGNRVYLVDGHSLRIIDVSDPTNPREQGLLEMPAFGVAVQANLAYVANGEGGLQIVDVRDPARPHKLGAYNNPGSDDPLQPNTRKRPYAYEVAVKDTLAYVAYGDAGLRIVDISDTHHPREVGHFIPYIQLPDVGLLIGGSVRGVAVGDLVYVADGDAGLVLLKVQRP
ncbi:MAG: hypothetical protein HY314_13780 [Acidobacteria bacterium]|nr:hypothetical protein [Acidobacteriota bacterium]